MAKKETPTASPDLVAELRAQIEAQAAQLDRVGDQLGDTRSQVRHLEKANQDLVAENEALHRSLRTAQCARAHAEGRAEALEAFAPDVLVQQRRFRKSDRVLSDLFNSPARGARWFEEG